MGLKAFVFDLDMTLVDSALLESWRRSGHWSHVRNNLGMVRPFSFPSGSAHEMPGKLRALGYRIAIATSSVGWYAQALLERFKIEHDCLIAYEDTERRKPDPQPIEAALGAIGVSPSEAVHVGDSPIDVQASYLAGVTSIGAGWGVSDFGALSSAAPDLLLMKPATLTKVDEFARRGYFAEAAVAGIAALHHRGAMLRCGQAPARYGLGRYFGREDPRHGTSVLSNALLEFKQSDAPAKAFAQALAASVAQMNWTPDYVVPVPPKPSQARNRFKALLAEAEALLPEGTAVQLDGLTCVKEVENYKTMGLMERAEAIDGAFITKYEWRNDKVLLVDDVLTTGGTVEACARVLLARGASEVRIVALGRDQQVFARKRCPACDRPMRVRNNRNGEKFWGCSGYPDHCQNTENF